MQLNIGETIRQLRRRDGRTQQEMADMLGITPQAISRWEAGVAYPDIEIIPKIADYFDVSTDFLYGRAPNEREIEIERVRGTVWGRLKEEKRWSEACELLRLTLKRYPKEYRLMMDLSSLLHLRSMREKEQAQQADELRAESIEWAERVLAECPESDLRYEAAFQLKHTYCCHCGMDFKIRSPADSMPPLSLSRENILCYVSDEREAARNCRKYSLNCLREMVYFLRWHSNGQDSIAVSRMLIGIIRTYFPDEDYEYEQYEALFFLYAGMVHTELEYGAPEQGLKDLEDLCTLLEKFYRLADGKTEYYHTSPALAELPGYPLSDALMGNFWRYCTNILLEDERTAERSGGDQRFFRTMERLMGLREKKTLVNK